MGTVTTTDESGEVTTDNVPTVQSLNDILDLYD